MAHHSGLVLAAVLFAAGCVGQLERLDASVPDGSATVDASATVDGGDDASFDASTPHVDAGAHDAGPSGDGGVDGLADGGMFDAGVDASTPTDDAPYMLHGVGFGENAPADQLWMGGKSGIIERSAVDHDIAKDPRWYSDTSGNGVTKISDLKAWSYGHAIMADSATAPMGPNGSAPWQGIFSAAYDTGTHFQRLTLHYKVLWEDQSAALGQAPLTNMQWKMIRLGYSAGVSDADVPNTLFTNWMSQCTFSRQGGDHLGSWPDEKTMPRINTGWYTVELEHVLNAPLSVANGSFRVRVRRMSDGVVTADEHYDSIQYVSPADPHDFLQWIVFQNYQGNLNQGQGSSPDINPSRIFMDDVYVLTGGSGAYVVLADAPVWANVTHEEIQPFDAWSDTQIHLSRLNRGAFSDLSGKYLYVKTSPSTVTREQGYPLR